MYTIRQVSEISGIPVSALLYCDREGTFPGLKRRNGIRRFSDHDQEAADIIECPRRSGLEIKDICIFIRRYA